MRVPPKGPRSYVAIARDQYGEQELTTIGTDAELTLEQARDIARERIRRIKAGKDAVEKPKPKPESVESVLSGWLKRHVDPGGLRTEREIRRIIAKYILPNWGDRDFAEIKRSNIAALLDGIEDNHGARTSDTVLAVLRGAAAWLQAETTATSRHSSGSSGARRPAVGSRTDRR